MTTAGNPAAPGRRGARAETLAREYLERRGLRCLACNFRCRRGEIDLVMRDGEELVFVEVRYRRAGSWGDAAATVTRAKQRRIIAAANHYLHRYRLDCPCRIDVLAMDGDSIDWIVNAVESC